MKRRFAAVHLRRLRTFKIEINYDRILIASYHHSFTGFIRAGVDLLMRYIGWDVDEVARSCFAAEFQMIPPSHPSPASKDVKDSFQFAVVVRSSLYAWPD
jgi:hypothetical protein